MLTQIKIQSGGEVPVIEGLEDIVGNKYRTLIKRVDNIKFSILNRDEKIFELKGSGIISEINIISSNTTTDNKDYKARVIADGEIIYNDSWDGFNNRTMHEVDMSAFNDENDSKYVLLFKDICYDESCYLEIYESHADFDYVNIKYHEKIGFL